MDEPQKFFFFFVSSAFMSRLSLPSTSTLFSLAGKRVLVTGAARGIGRCIASRLLDWGAMVAAADYNSEGLQKANEILLRSPSSYHQSQ
jgi:FlaA1/EpsC-like NDP-sugar epimerase